MTFKNGEEINVFTCLSCEILDYLDRKNEINKTMQIRVTVFVFFVFCKLTNKH